MDSKYITIYNEIVSNIENKLIKPNEKLPSENDLMQKYEVSRDTIRKALNLLEQNGYIVKIKARGSFVLDINKFDFPVSGLTSFKELSTKFNLKSKTIVQEFDLINPDDYLMKQLNISKENRVWKVIRIREIDGQKIILDKDFINKDYVKSLTCLLYTSPSPRDRQKSRMPSSA